MSGVRDDRPEFLKMLDIARPGDVIVVWRLDRLGRSLRHLIETVNQMSEWGIELKGIKENINTTPPTGKLMFHIVGAIAAPRPYAMYLPFSDGDGATRWHTFVQIEGTTDARFHMSPRFRAVPEAFRPDRKLSEKRKYSQAVWLIISGGKRKPL